MITMLKTVLIVSILLGGCDKSEAAGANSLNLKPSLANIRAEICAGHFLTTKTVSASDEIQACIDMGAAVVSLPSGRIFLDRQISIKHPVTLTTTGATDGAPTCTEKSASCAHLVVSPNFNDSNGILAIANTQNVKLDHIIVDGNRSNRLRTPAAAQCAAGQNNYGKTITVHGCAHCTVNASTFQNALCGSPLEWIGDDATIANNLFVRNGDSRKKNMWADGLTTLQANDSRIIGNTLIDNSDVGLIVGGGRNLEVRNNRIQQKSVTAFAGLMLDNFSGSQSGDFKGAVISGNKIECEKCFFAFNIGPLPWYRPAKMIFGGEVSNNEILGGTLGLNIDGVSSTSPMRIRSNRFGISTPATKVRCRSGKVITSTRFSVSAESSLTPDSSVPQIVQSTAGCI